MINAIACCRPHTTLINNISVDFTIGDGVYSPRSLANNASNAAMQLKRFRKRCSRNKETQLERERRLEPRSFTRFVLNLI